MNAKTALVNASALLNMMIYITVTISGRPPGDLFTEIVMPP
jgi:hypothetical protein